MASRCTKCGNTESYNFALNIGKCNPCIGERIEELEIENGKLNIILYHRENGLSHADFNAEIEISKQSERIEEIEDELEQHRWIPVSEEMPAQISGHWGSEIVFATDGKQAWACKYNYSAEYWTAPSGDITHWKPIILP